MSVSEEPTITIVDDEVRTATENLIQSYGFTTRGYRVPMIFITAFPAARLRAQAEASGAIGFLSKPFKADVRMTNINAALGLPP